MPEHLVRAQPPPSHIVFDGLISPNIDPARPWLKLLDDEVFPRITESAGPTLVVWSSIWIKRPAAQIRFDIKTMDTALDRWTLLDIEDPGLELVGHMCKRLNVLINAELRYSFGQ